MSINIHKGSILEVQADALVNPANSFLNHAGGLAAIIAKAAMGPAAVNPGMDEREWFSRERRTPEAEAWADEQRNAPLIATGNVYVTSAGCLPHKAIIHAVGPIWNGGNFMETDLLEIAMESAMDECVDRGFQSVAVPAISCGIFGFPVPAAARILTNVASWYDIATTFALMEDDHAAEFQKSLFG